MAAALDSIVDERGSPDKRILSADTPILQPTAERRSTGSHYTPRSLTEPIVRHALEPVFERLGPDARPEDVLELKICDPAMGSGAFLVEACRALAARLVQAWARWPETRPKLPPDEDEDLHARRLVAQRCLYGVDKNPMATDLAKLSLWLATLARDHEFTFVDHALKSGDSLVGLSRAQIAAVHWDSSKPGLPLFQDLIRERFEAALAGRAEIRDAPDDVERAIQETRYRHIEQRLSDARLLGDAVIAAFFSADKPRGREIKRQEIESWLNEPPAAMWMKVGGLASTLRQGERAIPPFHWELEFPEVFARENPGFHAIVGNPPFLGGSKISTLFTPRYLAWLLGLHSGSIGTGDLVAHFFRRAFNLLSRRGVLGLLATNSIAQGDTRETGLTMILGAGGSISHAIARLRWPGDASVIVSVVHITNGPITDPLLNGKHAGRISAYLVPGNLDRSPQKLARNSRIAFEGSKPHGMGFIFDDNAAREGLCSSLQDMMRLVEKDPRNSECIFPYIGGEEVNTDPSQSHHRYIIDFGDRSETQVRANWPSLMDIVELLVRPKRMTDNREARRMRWWLFGERSSGLYTAISRLSCILAISRIMKHHALTFLPSKMVFSERLDIIALSAYDDFALLQSRVHELWSYALGSTMKDDPVYSPSEIFETFVFPDPFDRAFLAQQGRLYYEFRTERMLDRHEGMTSIYNRVHQRQETAADIVQLRALHEQMDRAVLRAYGWDDLAERAEPQFLDETNEDDHKYQGRLFWPAEFRDEVLAHLLALNAERAAAEREREPSASRPRAKRAAKGRAEAELRESAAANEDD